VKCDKFVLDRWTWQSTQQIGGDNRFHILVSLAGSIQVAGDPALKPLRPGQTLLLPASLGTTEVIAETPSVLLDIYLP
jgi:mannose-6-phosphate isomerase class I